ncbi:nitrate/nitrite-sensing histidine kinase with HAMP domain-containing protein [Saccharomonospora azurea SZMC 14600]|nr:nitrate/nitrite-sensing histidine kinase with HAMP domain-containing protein [Saccharomonospora azurea SZMC 14600]
MGGDEAAGGGDDYDPAPEQARSRLSAFQQGTRRARQHQPGPDESGD